MVGSGRDRLLAAAMRLFGERGYAATTVAMIEAEAGLTPGAGGLYAHFRSKEAVLRAGLEAILQPEAALPPIADPDGARAAAPEPGLAVRLEAVARAGLARLEHDRDFNRILVRDLRNLPDLLEMTADREIRPVHARLAAQLAAAGPITEPDAQALAAVLIGAVSHLWLMNDVFGSHPATVSSDDYLSMVVRCAAAILEPEET